MFGRRSNDAEHSMTSVKIIFSTGSCIGHPQPGIKISSHKAQSRSIDESRLSLHHTYTMCTSILPSPSSTSTIMWSYLTLPLPYRPFIPSWLVTSKDAHPCERAGTRARELEIFIDFFGFPRTFTSMEMQIMRVWSCMQVGVDYWVRWMDRQSGVSDGLYYARQVLFI